MSACTMCKCVSALLNDKKRRDSTNGIRHKCELNSQGQITNIDERKWDFMYILKSHKLNCELNCCIENACCDTINDLKNESMRK